MATHPAMESALKHHHKKSHTPMHATPIRGTRTPVAPTAGHAEQEPDPNEPGEAMEPGENEAAPMPMMRGQGGY